MTTPHRSAHITGMRWITASMLGVSLALAGCAADDSPSMEQSVIGGTSGGSAGAGGSGGGGAGGIGGGGAGGASGTAGTSAAGQGGVGGQGGVMNDAAVIDPLPDGSAPDAMTDAATDDAVIAGYRITFRDEFNGAEGEGVDETKWTPMNKGDGFGNNELQYYTPRTENARMDGAGSLIIEVREEPYMGREYTSARLESLGKFEQSYGRFEVRAKLPFGQGIWPAFWLLGSNIGSVSWPQCGEIDIMEHVGRTPSTNYGSLHGPNHSGGGSLTYRYELAGGARFADDFHVYAAEWEENVVRWYVDGELYGTRTPSDVPEGGQWVYDHAFFMILNVAVGGAFPGSPDDSTMFPQRLLVDYVRVYERE